MGGLINFPQKGMRRGDAEWNDRESAPMATRTERDASLIRWTELARQRDGDDDSNGGGGAAA